MKNAKIKTRGIVLKTSDYKENGNIITILTSKGLENLIVRGSKKPSSKMRSLVQLFNEIEIVQTDYEGLNTITEGVVTKSFSEFYDNILNMSYASIILEKILILNTSISDYEILYNFLIESFNLLSKTKYPEIITLIFEVKLLYLLGLAPNFKKCGLCGKPGNGHFVLSEGGIICDSCINTSKYLISLSTEETEIFKLLYLIKMDKINQSFYETVKNHYQKINYFIDQYYNYFLDFSSKTKKIINQIT